MNSYVLNNLYNQGIIDYVPYELCSSPVVSSLGGMANSYINTAMQGSLYKNSNINDSFISSNGINQNNMSQTSAIASQTDINALGGMNGNLLFNDSQNKDFGALGGINNNKLFNHSNPNNFFADSFVNNSSAGLNANGGFGRVGDRFSNAFNNTVTGFSALPGLVKGIFSLGIIGTTLYLCLKGKKNMPAEPKQSFLSKLQFWKKNK